MKRLLLVAPHLSTGGSPQYLVKKVELLRDEYDVFVVEYSDVTGGRLVVQRNRLISLLKNPLITLGDDKSELLNVIRRVNPHIVHMEEIPEMFCDNHIANQIYDLNRTYSIYETSHDSSFDVHYKRYIADKMIMVSEYQRKLYEPLGIPIEVIDYPIEFLKESRKEEYMRELGLDPTKKHILNVGLFTPRKNQKEFFEYARRMPEYQFHSVGNMADNFKFYWDPLLKDVPPNLKIWDERSDVHKFFEAMDLFLFTSRGSNTDKETMPLVLKEAVASRIPIFLYNLDVYEDFFEQFNNINYLNFDSIGKNVEVIKQYMSNINDYDLSDVHFTSRWDWDGQKMYYSTSKTLDFPVRISIHESKSNAVAWSSVYDVLYSGVEYWMMPAPLSHTDYQNSEFVSGIKLCIYDERSGVKLYENSFFNKFVDNPEIKLSTSIPYFMNYLEFFVNDKYKKYLNKPYDIVVDVGANVGVFTSYLLHKNICKNIISVECDTRALKDLRNNFSTNPSVTIIDKALHYDNSVLEFYEDTNNPIVSSTVPVDSLVYYHAGVNENRTKRMLDTITLKEITDTYGVIDLLKVDIEGGEYSIFDRVDNSVLDKLNNLLIECHFFESDYVQKYQNLLLKLQTAGFLVEEYEVGQAERYKGGSEVIFARRVDTNFNKISKTDMSEFQCKDKRELASLFDKLYPHGVGVEIGVLRGDYSRIILERWSSGTLYLVDTWRHISEYIDMNGRADDYHYQCMIETCKNILSWQDRAHMIRMDSTLASTMFPDEYFDFIYIDADHSYEAVVRDINAWWPKLKKGGMFCGDDYIPYDGDIWLVVGDEKTYAGKFGVRRAVTEFSVENSLTIYETTDEPYWKQWYTFKPY
jgi:FkbM family methyltransferase